MWLKTDADADFLFLNADYSVFRVSQNQATSTAMLPSAFRQEVLARLPGRPSHVPTTGWSGQMWPAEEGRQLVS